METDLYGEKWELLNKTVFAMWTDFISWLIGSCSYGFFYRLWTDVLYKTILECHNIAYYDRYNNEEGLNPDQNRAVQLVYTF